MKTSGPPPRDVHPALQRDRLTAIARLVWAARVSAARDANWDLGDNIWTIGCVGFKRTCTAISRAAVGELKPFLSVRDRSHHFVFQIGGVPIRVYRGDIDGSAPERFAVPDLQEQHDLQLAFDLFDTPTPSAIFRLIVETDRQGFPVAIFLAQVEPSGEIVNPWRIPLSAEEEGYSDGAILPLAPSPVTPPAPSVGDAAEESSEQQTRKKGG